MKQPSPAPEQVTDKDQQGSIKAAIILDNLPLAAKSEGKLKSAIVLQEPENWTELAPEQINSGEQRPPMQEQRKSGFGPWFGYLSAAIVLLSMVELVLFIIELSQSADWLAGLWLILSIALLVLLGVMIVGEWRGLKQLRRQERFRASSQQLFDVPAIGLGKSHCLALGASMPDEYQQALSQWQGSLAEHHTDSEVISLFECSVMAKADHRALAIVSSHAGAAGVMIAVSPFALLDMAIVLWRNIRMLNQISEAYGVKLGYWGRMSLMRRVFHTMLYAGAAEIISDAGNYALGAGLSGKLSTRIGQGMGAGVLTARIGLKAMQECRPMPWLATPQPKLAEISKNLLADLSKHLN